jgi:hypothetical protein
MDVRSILAVLEVPHLAVTLQRPGRRESTGLRVRDVLDPCRILVATTTTMAAMAATV